MLAFNSSAIRSLISLIFNLPVPVTLATPLLTASKYAISILMLLSSKLRHNVSACLSAVASLKYVFFFSSSDSIKSIPLAIVLALFKSLLPKNAF